MSYFSVWRESKRQMLTNWAPSSVLISKLQDTKKSWTQPWWSSQQRGSIHGLVHLLKYLTCRLSGVCDRPRQEAEAVHPLPGHHREELWWDPQSYRLSAADCAEEGGHTRRLEGRKSELWMESQAFLLTVWMETNLFKIYYKFMFFIHFQPGDKVMVIPSLPDSEATALFPKGVATKELPSGKKYLRTTQIWGRRNKNKIIKTNRFFIACSFIQICDSFWMWKCGRYDQAVDVSLQLLTNFYPVAAVLCSSTRWR